MANTDSLTLDEIDERVQDIDGKRNAYKTLAEKWEKMWSLKIFKDSAEKSVKEKGQEQVLVSTPYNVVGLGRRLLATEAKIEVPSMDGKTDRDDRAEHLERWLGAFWELTNRQQERVIQADAVWQQMVRGRGCYQPLYVKPALPYEIRTVHLPLTVRTPDPLDVGVCRNALYTEFAYTKILEQRALVEREYPKLKLPDADRTWNTGRQYVEVVDFWYRGKSGRVWHAVKVDQAWGIKPTPTDYPDIPIVEFMGDSAPLRDEEMRGLSILFPLKDTWEYYTRMLSQMGTGLLHFFWPLLLWKSASGQMQPNLTGDPGQIIPIAADGDFLPMKLDVNQPLVQSMLQLLQQGMSEATFPAVMYGDSGGMNAGYGVSMLADAARGRIQMFLANHEMALEKVNALVLGIAEKVVKDDIEVWGRSSADNRMYRRTLKPERDIKGNYSNIVSLKPAIPQDDTARENLGLQKISAGVMSRRTYMDRVSSMPMPSDEDNRILVEQARMHPAIQARMSALALVEANPDDWIELIQGTPLEQELPMKYRDKVDKWRQEQMAKRQAKGLPGPVGMMPPPGMMPPSGGMPPTGMPGGMPPQGPMGAPGMPPMGAAPMQGAPGPQGSGPSGMPSQGPNSGPMDLSQLPAPPPELVQLAQAVMAGQVDPNTLPPEAQQAVMMVIQMMQQGQGGGPMNLQSPGLPMQGGPPPAALGQMTPQTLGITPQMQDANPLMFQQMTGQPMSREEQLDRLLGLPEGM